MVDLTDGSLGKGTWFSSLLLQAIRDNFKGLVKVTISTGDAVVFFSDGRPSSCFGTGFLEHHLGQLLIDRSLCTRQEVEAALTEQQRYNGERPLLGTILVRNGLDPNEIKRIIQSQTRARLGTLFQQSEGQWVAAHGDNAQSRKVAVPLDPWATFFELMETRVSRNELRHQTDKLLGKSVKLCRGGLMPERAWSSEEARILKYLDRPRKPHQLEGAFPKEKRRLVQGFLRALDLMERIQLLPLSNGVGISRVVKKQLDTGTLLPPNDVSEDFNRYVISDDMNPHHREVIGPRKAKNTPHPIIAEVKTFYEEMEGKNHYKLLGIEESADVDDIKERFRGLMRRFHTDVLAAANDPETVEKGREIGAKLNEAHALLTSPAMRKEYDEALKDERIKGDYNKRRQIMVAKTRYEMGIACLRTKDYARARQVLKEAVENDPSSGTYLASLAWATYSDPSKRAEARESTRNMLMEALDKDPDSLEAHLFMAKLYQDQGRAPDAYQHWKDVLRLDPRNSEALQAKRTLKKQFADEKNNNNRSGGLFGFFGRRKNGKS